MTRIDPIAPDIYRISTFVPAGGLQFNQFLVADDEPLLYHTGQRRMFPAVLEAVKQVLDPARIRWIGFSHFEADECGALNEWLAAAPSAQVACSPVAALVNLADFAVRPARAMADGEVLETGRHRFKVLHTPHVPHAWDASVLYDETSSVLFCSDLLHQNGDVEPILHDLDEVTARARQVLAASVEGPMAYYQPLTSRTERTIERLAQLSPSTLAIMHGSTYVGDGGRALRGLVPVMRELFGA